ncbi:copper chaperone [Paraburkholderia domus]|uniref:copper chaperone n=1 Tax=Paraburkholderia domus TaxID=2793075 RepID=UPI001B1D2FD3|nr:copper chaperone [Paraburkholderia domus]CAE6841004.1 hypothetical protein R75483_07149 [Paraburkholderia domus]
MEFKLIELTGSNDVEVIAHAIRTVDPDAKIDVDVNAMTVRVESWLMAEEFLIAFTEAGYDVKITKG